MGRGSSVQNEITIKELWNDLTLDTADVNNNIKAVQSGIETILENQASLMALFKGGKRRKTQRERFYFFYSFRGQWKSGISAIAAISGFLFYME